MTTLYYQLAVTVIYAIIGIFKIKQAGYFVPVLSLFNENIYLVTSMCYIGLAGAYLCKTLYYKDIKSLMGVPFALLFTIFLITLVLLIVLGHTVYKAKKTKEE